MDHGDHDHGNHDEETVVDEKKCSMSMIFHGGASECIVFRWWNASTLELFIVSAIAVFIITLLYEGLKFYREKLNASKVKALKESSVNLTSGAAQPSVKEMIFNKGHFIQALLHMLQMAVSYFLMLVAMTYNAYLILAVILGAGAGYFVFGWIRQRSEHFEADTDPMQCGCTSSAGELKS